MDKHTRGVVLLVEADPHYARLRIAFLEKNGYEVIFVRTGLKAVAAVQERSDIRLILMNIDPGKGIDGPEAARRILAEQHLPIIFITIRPDEQYIARVQDIARYGYILQDSDDFVLRTTIDMALDLYDAHINTLSSEERYRRITECLTDYRYTVYLEKGQPVRTVHNAACVAVTGYTPEEMYADDFLWLNMIYPEDLEEFKNSMISFYKGTEVREQAHRIIAKTGEVRWINTTLIPRFDRKGQLIEYDGVVKDITDRKRSEELLIRRAQELVLMQEATINSMAVLAEFRDPETGAHIQRTKEYVKLILEKMSDDIPYTATERELIWHCAPLHDIGKVGIPDSILLKEALLSQSEFEMMKKHPVYGYEVIQKAGRLLGENSFLTFASEITRYHHEKWDGSGYPYGLKGLAIPLSARIMALADVYDALVTARPYKQPISHRKAVKLIENGSGNHFDPALVDIFLENHREFDRIATVYGD